MSDGSQARPHERRASSNASAARSTFSRSTGSFRSLVTRRTLPTESRRIRPSSRSRTVRVQRLAYAQYRPEMLLNRGWSAFPTIARRLPARSFASTSFRPLIASARRFPLRKRSYSCLRATRSSSIRSSIGFDSSATVVPFPPRGKPCRLVTGRPFSRFILASKRRGGHERDFGDHPGGGTREADEVLPSQGGPPRPRETGGVARRAGGARRGDPRDGLRPRVRPGQGPPRRGGVRREGGDPGEPVRNGGRGLVRPGRTFRGGEGSRGALRGRPAPPAH